MSKNKCAVYGILAGKKWEKNFEQSRRVYDASGLSPTIHTSGGGGQEIKIIKKETRPAAMRGRNPDNPKSRKSGEQLRQHLEVKNDGICNAITTVPKDALVAIGGVYTTGTSSEFYRGVLEGVARTCKADAKNAVALVPQSQYDEGGNRQLTHKESDIFPTLLATQYKGGDKTPKVLEDGMRIRRLTPLECFRLMDFDDDDFDKAKAAGVSNSQLYKQAGNSICVGVLEAIFKQMMR